jgi:hypothetical protein
MKGDLGTFADLVIILDDIPLLATRLHLQNTQVARWPRINWWIPIGRVSRILGSTVFLVI